MGSGSFILEARASLESAILIVGVLFFSSYGYQYEVEDIPLRVVISKAVNR